MRINLLINDFITDKLCSKYLTIYVIINYVEYCEKRETKRLKK
jgi:hypothetical protein